MTWFGVLKRRYSTEGLFGTELSYINENDDICCAEARKKMVNIFVKKKNLPWNALAIFVDATCDELRDIEIVSNPYEEQVTTSNIGYVLRLESGDNHVEIMITFHDERQFERIFHEWEVCDNEMT